MRRPQTTDLLVRGRVAYALFSDRTWIARRVETVRYLDATRLERRVTLDIDGERLRELVAGQVDQSTGRPESKDGTRRHRTHDGLQAGAASPSQDGALTTTEIELPIALLEKGLLLDLDLTVDGTVAQVLTSDIDSAAATGILLQVLRMSEVSVENLPASIVETIYRATREQPSLEDIEALSGLSPELDTVEAWRLRPDLHGDEEEETRQWAELLEQNDRFWSLLGTFTTSFMLMVKVADYGCPSVIKLRYIETQEPADMTWQERWGWRPYVSLMEAPGVASASREHLRVEAPPGVLIADGYLWSVDDRLRAGLRPQPPSNSRIYQKRISLTRASFYTSGLKGRPYVVVLSMRADPTGFLRQAQYAILLAIAMLAAGTIGQIFFGTLGQIRKDNTESAVALMLLAPTFLLAYVTREGDHQILGDLLRGPRVLVASTGVATLLAAAVLIGGVSGHWLVGFWIGCTSWSVVVLCWLIAVNIMSKKAIKSTLQFQGTTEVTPLTIIND